MGQRYEKVGYNQEAVRKVLFKLLKTAFFFKILFYIF